jgi:hypothetical protein
METQAAYKQKRMAIELASRLERVSADSYWAHRASGCRVAILRFLDHSGINQWETGSMDSLIEQGYRILEKAAKDLRGT